MLGKGKNNRFKCLIMCENGGKRTFQSRFTCAVTGHWLHFAQY